MIKSWITRKLTRPAAYGPVAPDAPLYAIGDIHGRMDLLQELLDQLDPDIPVFCLGDYVDRGGQSREVLEFLHGSPAITCLRGNHESMLLDFLFGPNSAGPVWLRNGGMATLASFGVAPPSETADQPALEQAAFALRRAMGEDLISWLLGLPLIRLSGNVALVHAGADPHAPIDRQREDVLTWGHPEFTRTPRRDGIWVVHGHRVVDRPRMENGRISVDTGAHATGHLTAARIGAGKVDFIST